MTEPICPSCGVHLPPGELAEGWCETCGKRIPAHVPNSATEPSGRDSIDVAEELPGGRDTEASTDLSMLRPRGEDLYPASVEDIYYDLESDSRSTRFLDFLNRGPAASLTKGMPDVVAETIRCQAEPGEERRRVEDWAEHGRALIGRCGEQTQLRFRTLLELEGSFPDSGDYGFLIGPACQILEAEVARLLVEPARMLDGELPAALRAFAEHGKQADIVEKWLRRELPTTFGICSLVLLALRKGYEQGRVRISAHLAEGFTGVFASALANLGANLNFIRERYRNPSCHGTVVFDQEGYEQFSHLLLLNDSMRTWYLLGPKRRDGKDHWDGGTLHVHLSESLALRRLMEEERPMAEAPAASPGRPRWWQFWR
jgi:hypothetical protein